MAAKKKKKKFQPREIVQLVMHPHNIEALLKADEAGDVIHCSGVALRYSPVERGYVLILTGEDKDNPYGYEGADANR